MLYSQPSVLSIHHVGVRKKILLLEDCVSHDAAAVLGRRGLRFRFIFVLISGVAQGAENGTKDSSIEQEANGTHSMSIIYSPPKTSIMAHSIILSKVYIRFCQMEVSFFFKYLYFSILR